MFGISTQEIIIILVIALLILGPKQLPELAKTVGKGLSELRKAMDGVRDTVNPSKVFDKMMEEGEKKERAKKEAAKKGAPKEDSSAEKAGADAGKQAETTAQDQDTKDTAAPDEAKKAPGGDKELKG
ncbi:MAG: twin-arginine translocase TatA/TatE family subunit [Deltaproteobacteria bacterium]|nr:twin-arginine translocase TatA/TatE family subunit [Candidatus Zymogenaceae bacterium]